MPIGRFDREALCTNFGSTIAVAKPTSLDKKLCIKEYIGPHVKKHSPKKEPRLPSYQDKNLQP